MPMNVDMFDEGGAAVAAPTLAKITRLAEEAVNLQRLIEDLERNAKEASARLNTILNGLLPDEMAQSGMSSFTLSDGSKIDIKDFCSGSLPKDSTKKQAALDWLASNGGESLIKFEVGVNFKRSEHNQALALVDDLKKKGYPVQNEMGVHASTLQAFAREKLKNGEVVDLDTLGLYAGRVARIKLGAGK